jgi:PatG C-terminal
MEETAGKDQSANGPVDANDAPAIGPSFDNPVTTTSRPQTGGGTCPTCGGAVESNPDGGEMATYSYVYALGRVEPRFPRLAVEKEFAQATGRAETTAGLTDPAAFYAVLSRPQNRYLVRQLCWVLTIEGMETYILQPHDPADFNLMVEAIGPTQTPREDFDTVIGVRGPIAPPELCNGLMVPIVVFNQVYSFTRRDLIASIPRDTIPEEEFSAAAGTLFDRITQMADNAGATDEHRALNYLAVRYPRIYTLAVERHRENDSLTAIEVRPSRLTGVRKIVDVVFSYTHRQTDVTEKYFVRVDVTEEFPFLVTRLSPYYDR